MKVLSATALNSTAEYARGYYHVVVPNDTLTRDIFKPAWWANHTGRLKPGALVDVITEDRQLDFQFRCIDIAPGMCVMRLRFGYESDARAAEQKELEANGGKVADKGETLAPVTVPDGYKIGHTPALGHYVKLAVSGETIAQKLPSKAAATHAAAAHHERANRPSKAA